MKKENAKKQLGIISASPVSNAATASEADLQAQRRYVERMKDQEFDFSLTIADAFLQGMRRYGYTSTATAIDELIDNAMQASAQRVDVLFGYEKAGKNNQPTQLAIIDNGHGMDPAMIRLAMVWGGTHRYDDRKGFGRFGFGLPTASLSQGRKYSVISRVRGGPLSQVTFDSENLGDYGQHGKLEIPPAGDAHLPQWLQEHANNEFAGLPSGTIVLIEKLDNISWKLHGKLHTELARHLGVYYRNYLASCNLFVDKERVVPVDPLFLTEGALFYDHNGQRAQAIKTVQIPVKEPDTDRVKGEMTVRLSYMPWGFVGESSKTDDKDQPGRSRNPRFAILKQHNNGIVITRNHRQIDVVPVPGRAGGWWDMIHRDLHWGCEIDFPPSLDEDFNVTTSKQGVRLSPRIWALLSEAGVKETIRQMKTRRESERAEKSSDFLSPERASELVMTKIAKYKREKLAGDDSERLQKGVENLKREVERRTRESGVSAKEVAKALVSEIFERPYLVSRESAHDGPFYRIDLMHQQKQLFLNTDHRFFTDLYAAPDSTDRVKSALLLLLFILADSEIDANPERHLFYKNERLVWSSKLSAALSALNDVNLAELEDMEEVREQQETELMNEAAEAELRGAETISAQH